MTNISRVGRTFGNVNADYRPFTWLDVNYTLGVDYGADERTTIVPKSSSDFPQGRMVRADIVNMEIDHNLVATARRDLTDFANLELSVGQNLNQTEFSRYQVNGQTLIFGTDQLDFAIDRIPNEYREKVRTDGVVTDVSDVARDLKLRAPPGLWHGPAAATRPQDESRRCCRQDAPAAPLR